jgi:hypothetical protein
MPDTTQTTNGVAMRPCKFCGKHPPDWDEPCDEAGGHEEGQSIKYFRVRCRVAGEAIYLVQASNEDEATEKVRNNNMDDVQDDSTEIQEILDIDEIDLVKRGRL